VATAGAFAINNGILFEALGVITQPFVLSTNFYTRSDFVLLFHGDLIRSDFFIIISRLLLANRL
jgi:hypothetical protein